MGRWNSFNLAANSRASLTDRYSKRMSSYITKLAKVPKILWFIPYLLLTKTPPVTFAPLARLTLSLRMLRRLVLPAPDAPIM